MNRNWHSLTPEVGNQKSQVRSQRSNSVLCPLSSFLCLLFSVMVSTCPALAAFRAAIVLRDVTPAPLLPVSGGVGPSEPVDRKIGELTVRALVLEKDNTRVAICSTDFLGFPGVLCSRVHRQVSGIPPENILIGATHNHSGPDCYGFPNEDGQTATDVEYLNTVCTKLADAINQAVRRLQPSHIRIATGRARGKIAYNYYAEGRPLATLVNYACHPEVIGPDQGILCPDFVGPLYDRIRKQGGGVGIFMNGALGGMVTADCRGPDGKDIQTWDECIRIGHLLADESLRIVADAPVLKNPTLFCGSATVEFAVESKLLLSIIKLSPLGFELNERGTIAAQVNVVNLADAQILTIPGEALPNIGYYLKRKMHGRHNFLFGLTNDAFGYILTKVDWNSFDRYDYISRTCLGEMTGEIFIEKAIGFVDACPRPESRTN
ncbi:MAG: hypothetical protein AMJ75_10055 [Phycisphaerae bacterium SM1_79]|nr:MAG: hypothetical protein AMJ75_10055 [Phycisphaerae bacterium SM1_79]